MHARGVAENNAGRPARAARILRRSLAQLAFDSALDSRAGQVLAGRIWLSLALAETEWHGPEAGLAAMVQAQHFAASADDAALRVLVHAQLGAIQLRLGALQESLSELDQAVALLDDAAPVDRCNMLLSRGYVHLYLGNLNQSRSDLALAAELAHKSGLLLEDFKARHNLGYVEFLAGELPKSLQIMDEAAQLGADLPRGIPLLDRARVLVEAGLISEADETLVAAEQIFARDRLLQGLGEVELARAECALLAAEPGTARRLAVTARGRFRRRGNDRWRRSAELVLLQADVARGRSGRAVEDEGRRLAAELGAEGLSAQSRVAAFVTAEALLDRGCPDEARAVADTAGPAKRSDPIGARLAHRLPARPAGSRHRRAGQSGPACAFEPQRAGHLPGALRQHRHADGKRYPWTSAGRTRRRDRARRGPRRHGLRRVRAQPRRVQSAACRATAGRRADGRTARGPAPRRRGHPHRPGRRCPQTPTPRPRARDQGTVVGSCRRRAGVSPGGTCHRSRRGHLDGQHAGQLRPGTGFTSRSGRRCARYLDACAWRVGARGRAGPTRTRRSGRTRARALAGGLAGGGQCLVRPLARGARRHAPRAVAAALDATGHRADGCPRRVAVGGDALVSRLAGHRHAVGHGVAECPDAIDGSRRRHRLPPSPGRISIEPSTRWPLWPASGQPRRR